MSGEEGGVTANRESAYERAMGFLGHQDSLLQSYRGIFLSAESVLLAVGALVPTRGDTSPVWTLPILVVGILITVVWWRTCRHRGRDVDFFQTLLRDLEEKKWVDSSRIFSDFKIWQDIGRPAHLGPRKSIRMDFASDQEPTKSRKVRRLFFSARGAIDLMLPAAFFAAWLFLLVLLFC